MNRTAISATVTAICVLVAVTSSSMAVDWSEDFSDGDFTRSSSWIERNRDDSPGVIKVTGTDKHVRFYRDAPSGNGGGMELVRSLDFRITDDSAVAFDVNPVFSNIGGGAGWHNGEYPIEVQLQLRDAAGRELRLAFCYNYRGGASAREPDFVRIAFPDCQKNVWLRDETFVIRDYFPQANTVNSITLRASGWDYEGCVDNVRLVNVEVGVGQEPTTHLQSTSSRYENTWVVAVGIADDDVPGQGVAEDAAVGLMAGAAGEALGRLLAEFTAHSLGVALSSFIGLVAEAGLVSPAPELEVGAFYEGQFYSPSMELELQGTEQETLGTHPVFPVIVFDNGAELGGPLTFSVERQDGFRWRSVKSIGCQWKTPGSTSTIDVLAEDEVSRITARPLLVALKEPITIPADGRYRFVARYGSGTGKMSVTVSGFPSGESQAIARVRSYVTLVGKGDVLHALEIVDPSVVAQEGREHCLQTLRGIAADVQGLGGIKSIDVTVLSASDASIVVRVFIQTVEPPPISMGFDTEMIRVDGEWYLTE